MARGRGAAPALAALLAIGPAEAAAGADLVPLVVDHARSWLVATTDRAGLLGFLGHRHAVLATGWRATIAASPDLARGTVALTVPAAGLLIDTEEAVRLAGLRARPDEETVRQLQAKMLGPGVLDAARHPLAEFQGEVVGAPGPGRLRLRGSLRLRGREQPLEVELAVDRLPDATYRFTGEIRIRQTAFGITPESVAGVVHVADPVTVRIAVVAAPRPP